jgi:hypothetical protein
LKQLIWLPDMIDQLIELFENDYQRVDQDPHSVQRPDRDDSRSQASSI